jgi:O-antigen/teichoic acid export membrane protein
MQKQYIYNKSFVKNKMISITNTLHFKIFGHEMSPTMRNFLKNISWSFVGIIFNSGLLFILNVIAGRLLGPGGYGKYNLVLTIANILCVFVLLAMDIVSIKFISSSTNEQVKREYLSNSLLVVICSSVSVFLIAIVFYRKVAMLLSVENALMLISVAYAILLGYKGLLDGFIRSYLLFKFQTFVKIIESVVVALFFVIAFFFFKRATYFAYVLSIISGMLFLVIIYLWKIKKYITHFDKNKLLHVLPYAKSSIFMVAVIIFTTSIDKIFVAMYLGERELGVYSAYLTATTAFIAQLIVLLDNVFLPMVNSENNKDIIIKKIDRLAMFFALPAIASIFFISSAVLYLFGKDYNIHFSYVIVFSVAAYLQMFYSIYRSIIMSIKKPYEIFTKLSYLSPLLYVALLSLLLFYNMIELKYVIIIYIIHTVYYFCITRFSYELAR